MSELTAEAKAKIDKRALEDVVNSLKIHKIDYFSLPGDLKKAIIDIYISGAKMMYEEAQL